MSRDASGEGAGVLPAGTAEDHGRQVINPPHPPSERPFHSAESQPCKLTTMRDEPQRQATPIAGPKCLAISAL